MSQLCWAASLQETYSACVAEPDANCQRDTSNVYGAEAASSGLSVLRAIARHLVKKRGGGSELLTLMCHKLSCTEVLRRQGHLHSGSITETGETLKERNVWPCLRDRLVPSHLIFLHAAGQTSHMNTSYAMALDLDIVTLSFSPEGSPLNGWPR